MTEYTRTAGVSFRQAEVLLAEAGDQVLLLPEPDNQHDAEAVRVVLVKDGRELMLGYIPRPYNAVVLERIRAGRLTSATVDSVGDAKGGGHLRGVSLRLEFAEPVAAGVVHEGAP